MRFFSRRYRCIAFNARVIPRPMCPQIRKLLAGAWRDDIIAILDHSGSTGPLVGLSMGGFATLHVGLAHPSELARS